MTVQKEVSKMLNFYDSRHKPKQAKKEKRHFCQHIKDLLEDFWNADLSQENPFPL